ncbi:MAG: hypothetical protein IJX77_04980 [Ruminococcus sp.]|nr:hypothetical protein [Ruminococcus sp.]
MRTSSKPVLDEYKTSEIALEYAKALCNANIIKSNNDVTMTLELTRTALTEYPGAYEALLEFLRENDLLD